LYTAAAEGGDHDSESYLGVLLATELDPPELVEARRWLTAAEAGREEAVETLCQLPSEPCE
jgi:hypothetical protein